MSGCHPEDKIESEINLNSNVWEILSNRIIECLNRIESLHEFKLRQIDENRKLSKRVDEHEEGWMLHKVKIQELERIINSHAEILLKNKLSPYKCPVCLGSQKKLFELPGETYFHEYCKSCDGKGILWS